MKCLKCGAEVIDGTNFCPYCGATVSTPAAPKTEPAQPQYQAPQQPQYQPPQPQYQAPQPQYQPPQPQYQAPQPQYQPPQPQYQAPQPQYQPPQPQYQAPQPQYQPPQPQYRAPQPQAQQFQDPRQAQFQFPNSYISSTTVTPELPMKWFKFLIYFSLWLGALANVGSGIGIFALLDELPGYFAIIAVAQFALAGLGIYARFRLAGFYKDGPSVLNALYLSAAVLSLISAVLAADGTGDFMAFAVNMAMVSCNTTYFKKRAHLFTK